MMGRVRAQNQRGARVEETKVAVVREIVKTCYALPRGGAAEAVLAVTIL